MFWNFQRKTSISDPFETTAHLQSKTTADLRGPGGSRAVRASTRRGPDPPITTEPAALEIDDENVAELFAHVVDAPAELHVLHRTR